MTWMRIDDQFFAHPKAISAGPLAIGVWVLAGSWSCAYATGGVIPMAVAHSFGKAATWQRLTDAGLVEPRTDKRAPYVLHAFTEYNPLASRQDRATDRQPAPVQVSASSQPAKMDRAERMRELGRRGGLARAAKLADGASGASEIPSAAATKNVAYASQNPSGDASEVVAQPLAATLPALGSGSESGSPNSQAQSQTQSQKSPSSPPTSGASGDARKIQAADASASVAQPATNPSAATLAGWASSAEEKAGSVVLDRLRRASADASLPGPLASLATIKIARELLAYTRAEVCGYTGTLTLAALTDAIDSIASSERTRQLAPDATAKNGGDLIRYLMGAVKSQARGDVKPARQGASKPRETGAQPGTSREVIDADRARATRPQTTAELFVIPTT